MKQDEVGQEQIPAWKKHGRNGPFDWWMGCKEHGTDWQDFCFSCWLAVKHNKEIEAKLETESAEQEGGGE